MRWLELSTRVTGDTCARVSGVTMQDPCRRAQRCQALSARVAPKLS